MTTTGIGKPLDRVDGAGKVTGTARYSAEFECAGLLHGHAYTARIARGSITRIDVTRALAVAGVVDVLTHEHRPHVAWFDLMHKDMVAPPGDPFRPLYDATIHYSGQPIALVIAETPEIARYAVTLIEVDYETKEFATGLAEVIGEAFSPVIPRLGFHKPKSRGDADEALARSPVRIAGDYHLVPEHHNPMELFATTIFREDDGTFTIHDKTQGVTNTHLYICNVMGWDRDKVRVLSPFVGGAFGSALRPVYQLYLAALGVKQLGRPVRVVMTRAEMFGHGYRPECLQHIELGAERDGRLTAIVNEAVTTTSRYEHYMETVVNWGAMAYRCENARLASRIAAVDTATPCDMRAPGGATGMNLFEIAMDELAYACAIDPLELRLRNYADRQQMSGKPYTSKKLRECYEQGARRFGWERRSQAPRSMRDGRELIGWGMATGIWEALMVPTSARAVLRADGSLEISTATADIGPGTRTMMVQVASEATGIAANRIEAKLGDSGLPFAPVQGGSWTAASAGAAVQQACRALLEDLRGKARKAGLSDPDRMRPGEVVAALGLDGVEAKELATPGLLDLFGKARNTHSAVFAEVRLDEEVGMARVTRIVNAVAAGRIVNPKLARSQVMGGVVFGMGMALTEATLADSRLGRFMNHSLGEYHVPVHADVPEVDVIFVHEPDDEVSPLGVKGVGEIGNVGTAAAIANALFHATGKRVRELPITLDKLL